MKGPQRTVASKKSDKKLEKHNEILTNAATHTKGQPNDQKAKDVVSSVAQVTLGQWGLILALIFGGCCSNVFTLEAIVSQQSHSGNLITFVQFVFVSIEGYIHFCDPKSSTLSRLYLTKPSIPLSKWIIPVVLFFAVSVLNNYVWKYNISVPVHIIFRSGGTVTTMIAGFFVGKRYKYQQVLAVIILTLGVILATLSNSPKKNNSSTSSMTDFTLGVTLLFVAAVLSSIMGLVSEKIYSKYGRHWRENLFYTHIISLPFFLPFASDIFHQMSVILHSEPKIPVQLLFLTVQIPKALLYLLGNGLTQYVCVRGVNNLAGNATALTVSIVLNVRKFVSLLLSIYLFGNKLSVGTIIGTILVFVGASLYSYSSSRPSVVASKKEK